MTNQDIKRYHFVKGAKWAAERMFNEEYMKAAFEAGKLFIMADILGESRPEFEQWLKERKKK